MVVKVSMGNDIWKELAVAAEKDRKEYDPKINPTEANILIGRIMGSYDDPEEYYRIRDDVKNFLNSDASERDKSKVRGYTEYLAIMLLMRLKKECYDL